MNDISDLEKIESMPDNMTSSKPPSLEQPLNENINISNNETNNTFNTNEGFSNNSRYVSFKSRLSKRIVFFVITLIFFVISLLSYKNLKTTANYKENSNAYYRVCLNENDYYTDECLGEDLEYLSEITNKINVTFNYNAVFQEKTKKEYKYYVNSKLLIQTVNEPSKVLLEKDKSLTQVKTYNLDGNVATFVEDVDINFKEFNEYAKKYKNDYSLLSVSDLIVSLYVGDGKDYFEVSSVTIPLTKVTYNILKYEVKNNNKEYVVESQLMRKNILLIVTIAAAVLLLISILFIIKFLIDTRRKTSNYQKKINQILSTYDRVIISLKDSKTLINTENIYKVNSFLELLDVRDTINKPILYHKVNNVKSEFYVQDIDKVYIFTMKESDFE